MSKQSPITLTFFGTGSHYHAGRNQSCIGLSFNSHSKRKENWVFDCGDGTLRQMINLGNDFNRTYISKIFITHLHIDHVSGLPVLLSSLSFNHSDNSNFVIDVYGPPHVSNCVLPLLHYSDNYNSYQLHFHELLDSDEQLEKIPFTLDSNITIDAIYPDDDGFWTCFSNTRGQMRAGSLNHNVPCRGYCYEEFSNESTSSQHRKISIFGDTYDSESMKPLVQDSDLLVHEATFGPILSDINHDYLHIDITKWKEIQQEVLQDPKNNSIWQNLKWRARAYGHSNIEMAGTFAQEIHAKHLIFTHIGGRYDAKSPKAIEAIKVMFEEQAKEYFDGEVIVAYDGFQYHLSCCVCFNECFIKEMIVWWSLNRIE